MTICKVTASPGSQGFPSTYQRVTGQIITGHSPCPVYTVQNTLVKVGSKGPQHQISSSQFDLH